MRTTPLTTPLLAITFSLLLPCSPALAAGPSGGEPVAVSPALIQSDAVILGILLVMLGAIFWSSHSMTSRIPKMTASD